MFEETGLQIDRLVPVGSYPMYLYGGRLLQLTYSGRTTDDDVRLSLEHDDYQ